MTARWLIGAHRDGAAIKVTDRDETDGLRVDPPSAYLSFCSAA